ncbi:MAG: bacillithiol system redox-active protein YtxJ [Ectobacillus sp.]
MGKTKLQTEQDLNNVLREHSAFILFKHSLTCPISRAAYEEFQSYEETVPAFYLYVQEARPLSNGIAERFGVRHESPQVLYIKDGEVVWHASHWSITKKALEEHIQ